MRDSLFNSYRVDSSNTSRTVHYRAGPLQESRCTYTQPTVSHVNFCQLPPRLTQRWYLSPKTTSSVQNGFSWGNEVFTSENNRFTIQERKERGSKRKCHTLGWVDYFFFAFAGCLWFPQVQHEKIQFCIVLFQKVGIASL